VGVRLLARDVVDDVARRVRCAAEVPDCDRVSLVRHVHDDHAGVPEAAVGEPVARVRRLDVDVVDWTVATLGHLRLGVIQHPGAARTVLRRGHLGPLCVGRVRALQRLGVGGVGDVNDDHPGLRERVADADVCVDPPGVRLLAEVAVVDGAVVLVERLEGRVRRVADVEEADARYAVVVRSAATSPATSTSGVSVASSPSARPATNGNVGSLMLMVVIEPCEVAYAQSPWATTSLIPGTGASPTSR
jgi:hypothetical protein